MKPTRRGSDEDEQGTRGASVAVVMVVPVLMAPGMFLVSTVTSATLNAPANDGCLSTTALVQKAR